MNPSIWNQLSPNEDVDKTSCDEDEEEQDKNGERHPDWNLPWAVALATFQFCLLSWQRFYVEVA